VNAPIEKLAWLSNLKHYNYGNILNDLSTATMTEIQVACDTIQLSLKIFLTPPDPAKMPLAAKQLVSFQNRKWKYVLLCPYGVPP
jgi:hypothetical protein